MGDYFDIPNEKTLKLAAGGSMEMTGGEPMIDAIDGVNANSNSAIEYTLTFTHRTAPAQDSVVLSIDAQARLLEEQGLSIEEIANALGIASTAAQSDLGIPITITQSKMATA